MDKRYTEEKRKGTCRNQADFEVNTGCGFADNKNIIKNACRHMYIYFKRDNAFYNFLGNFK